MATTSAKKINFFESEEGHKAKASLQSMANSSGFHTKSSYSANTTVYPGNTISFVDKHMNYLNAHRDLNPDQYIANLRLMTRIG